MTLYKAFGLVFASELELPSLTRLDDSHRQPADVEIRYGLVNKEGLPGADHKALYRQARANHLWLHVPDIAWFEVIDGNRIIVMPAENADPQSIRLYVLGSCVGCILHQRHYLVMHANTIRFGNQCVMFAGASGSGKSTLAAAFQQRGYQVLADDVSAINLQGEVIPSYPQLKLWQDSAEQLDIDVSVLRKIRLQVSKYAYVLDDNSFCDRALPLAGMYLLNTHNEDGYLKEDIGGFNKFNPIKHHTYRPGYVKSMDLQTVQLKRAGQLVGDISITRVTRPHAPFLVEPFVDFLLEDLAQRGIAG